MVFVVCNLKLEMCLYRDHSVRRVDNKDTLDAEEIQNTLRNSRRTSKPSWFGWLMRNNNLSRVKEQPNRTPDKYGLSLSRRKSSLPSSVTKVSTDLEEWEDILSLTKNKFAKVISQMEKSIFSSSPGVKFPPPHLLTRLREEETEILFHNGNDEGSFKSFVSRDVRELVSNNPGTINSATKYRTYSSMSNYNHLSLDFQSGLTYLMTNNHSLNGMFNHQSISCSFARFWSPTSPVPCHNHEIIKMDYYNKTEGCVDKSLGEMIEWICDKANETCEEPSCEHPGKEHISTYTHNDGRISITVEESPDQKLKRFTKNIMMWTQCKLCSSKTPLILMSEATYHYSFAKYLEVLFYDENFACKGLCPHVELRDSLLRCFRRGDLVVKVEYEHVDLFEMRLPKLQINDDADRTCSGIEDPEKLFTISDDDMKRLRDETRLEITYFYGNVKQHITFLEEYFEDLPNKNKDSNSNGSDQGKSESDRSAECLKSLEELTKIFRAEEFELYHTLINLKVTVLNNVRQTLVERIRTTHKRLSQWKKEHIDPEDLKSMQEMVSVEPEYTK